MEKRRKNNFILMIAIALFFSSIIWCVEIGYGLRLNRSSSLPQTLFLSRKPDKFFNGLYVVINHPKNPSLCVAKIIVGLPGDPIEVKDSVIYVNHKNFGVIKSKSKSGRCYNAISFTSVPQEHVFLYAPHPDSFDSRYEEFGLVPISCIKEELCPIF